MDDRKTSSECPYVFDNAAPQTVARFASLPAMFDPGTIRHLQQIGVKEGWRCWEIGAGPGSIAAWLSDRVGSSGHVLATDIDTRFLERLMRPNLEVRRHNIVADPLPAEGLDLVHARLMLLHLPEREKALDHMIASLKPGGWILAEEFDSISYRPAPEINPAEVLLKALDALQRVMTKRGANIRFGRLLLGRMRARGLVDLSAEGRMFMWQGKSAGANLLRANLEQLREAMISAGYITERELDEDLARLDQEDFSMPSPILWAVSGHRP